MYPRSGLPIMPKDGRERRTAPSQATIMEATMTATQPSLAEADAISAGRALFDVHADSATNLSSERDQAWMLLLSGRPAAVIKVSNTLEDGEILDMEACAAWHATEQEPSLPIALPRIIAHHSALPHRPPTRSGTRHRAQWKCGNTLHWVRCYDIMPGRCRDVEEGALSDDLLHEWGATTARVSRALHSFFHPRANRATPWDVQNAAALRPLLPFVTANGGLRALCSQVLDIFDRDLQPRLRSLRHQVVHGDMNLGNVLLSHGHVSAILDFGDMSYTALVIDVAACLCSVSQAHYGSGISELVRMARVLIDGYQAVSLLEEIELLLLADLWMVRACASAAYASSPRMRIRRSQRKKGGCIICSLIPLRTDTNLAPPSLRHSSPAACLYRGHPHELESHKWT